MSTATAHQAIIRHFAALLSYPDGETRRTAAECSALLRNLCSEAVEPLEDFRSFLAAHETAQVEELFTATFDLQPACHPYVGYQLCGESQQRTMFLIKLQQLYGRHGFAAGGELPDHLSTMLRFIGTSADRACREELVRDGLLPALEKLLPGLDGGDQPYVKLLKALQNYLIGATGFDVESSGMPRPKEVCS